jgi:hypothetical protein
MAILHLVHLHRFCGTSLQKQQIFWANSVSRALYKGHIKVRARTRITLRRLLSSFSNSVWIAESCAIRDIVIPDSMFWFDTCLY